MTHGRIWHESPDGTRTDVTEGVQALYDLVINSMDWGSGFLTYEDARPVAEIAMLCQFDKRDDVQRYADAKLEESWRSALIYELLGDMPSYSDERKQAWAEIISAEHEHIFMPSGKCGWPGCTKDESEH